MRAQAAVLVLILAACSGPSAGSERGAGLRRQPEHGVSTGSTACAPARDPIAPPTGESVTAAIALGCEGGAVAVTGGSVPNPEFGMASGFGSIWFSVVRQPWLLRISPNC